MENGVPDAGQLALLAQGYRDLFGDTRLFDGFAATLSGILASGSTRVRQLARAAPKLGVVTHAERRVRRLVSGSNQRTNMNADTLGARLTRLGAARLAGQDEVVVILDGSDLRKPHSKVLEHLATVRALDGDLVPGYPTLNALGISGNGTRALLYHRTYSPHMSGYKSDNALVHDAVNAIVSALRAVGVGRLIFVLDRGYDDQKLMRLFQKLDVRFVLRAKYDTRSCRLLPTSDDLSLLEAVQNEPVQDSFDIRRPVSKDGKTKFRLTPAVVRQRQVFIDAGRLRLNVVKLDFNVPRQHDVQGWMLLTNLPTRHEGGAGAVVRLYLRRWAVEDVFSWTKQALGWEQVRLLHFEAIRTLVALAWIAASFVFSLGEDLNSPTVQLLAHLGGYVPHKNRPPGKKVLLWGLERLAAALLLEEHRQDPELRARLDALSAALFGPQ